MKNLFSEYLATDSISKKIKLIPKISEKIRRDTPSIQTFGLSTTEQIRNLLNMSIEDREMMVTLCPIYSSRGIDTASYNTYSDIPSRFRAKADNALFGAKILSLLFPARVKLLLADRGVMLDTRAGTYDEANFQTDIQKAADLYSARADEILSDIPFQMSSFSRIDVPIGTISTPDSNITADDIDEILKKYDINPTRFRANRDIIIESFGLPNAYNLIANYLAENAFLIKKFPNRIFLNTEFCGPLNSLYTASEDITKRLNQSSVFTRLDVKNNS